jgi:hypothetical protein
LESEFAVERNEDSIEAKKEVAVDGRAVSERVADFAAKLGVVNIEIAEAFVKLLEERIAVVFLVLEVQRVAALFVGKFNGEIGGAKALWLEGGLARFDYEWAETD